MRRFKSTTQAPCFLDSHASVYNLFKLGCHLVSAANYKLQERKNGVRSFIVHFVHFVFVGVFGVTRGVRVF